jgi:hypothetical protein
MPVKPENRALYPVNWSAISYDAKERASWRCQHPGCRAQQYDVGQWDGEHWYSHGHFGHELPEAYSQARQYAAEVQFSLTGDDPEPDPRIIVIVLTTAHLDHDPTNCDPGNLAALCQRHHLRYDHGHHMQSAYMTRMAKRGNLELPL